MYDAKIEKAETAKLWKGNGFAAVAGPSSTEQTGPHVHKDTLSGLLSPSLNKDAFARNGY